MSAARLFTLERQAIAPIPGVPQMLQARGQFGAHGAAVIVLVALVMFIGYFSSNLVVSIDSAHQIVPGLPGPPAVSLPFVVTGLYTGPLGAALDGVDLAWLVGFAVSCLGYYLLARPRPGLVRLRPAEAVAL